MATEVKTSGGGQGFETEKISTCSILTGEVEGYASSNNYWRVSTYHNVFYAFPFTKITEFSQIINISWYFQEKVGETYYYNCGNFIPYYTNLRLAANDGIYGNNNLSGVGVNFTTKNFYVLSNDERTEIKSVQPSHYSGRWSDVFVVITYFP